MSSISSLIPTPLALEHREVALVQYEMRRIEGLVREPRTLCLYVDLSRRLNAIQSTTRCLPIEVLSLIFQHASPPADGPRSAKAFLFHLALRLVSSHWYHVVQSTPQLWACIGPRGQEVNALGQYIKLCLDNSGSLLLTIFLSFPFTPRPDTRFLVSPTVDDALRRNMYRIKSVHVFCAPTLWFSEISEMVQLTSLSLGVLEDMPETVSMDLSMLTRIKKINLASPCIYELKLGPAPVSVTHLEFHKVPVDICVGVYLACQNVVDFQCRSQEPPRSSAVPEIPSSLLKRESLVLLSWELMPADSSHWNDYVLKWTRFPVLKTLWWTDLSHPHSNYDATEFFSHLPKSLTMLEFIELQPSTVDSDSLMEHIRHDCNTSEIKFSSCSEFFLNNVLQKLFKRVTVEDEEIIPFPNLISLQIDLGIEEEEWPSLSPDIGENFVRLLEERKEIIKAFKLSSANELDEWKDETWRRLEALEDNGLNLTILTLALDSYDPATDSDDPSTVSDDDLSIGAT